MEDRAESDDLERLSFTGEMPPCEQTAQLRSRRQSSTVTVTVTLP